MRSAPALDARHRLADFRVGRLWIRLQKRGGGHDPAREAVAALRHLLFDVRLLERMRALSRAEAGERGHAFPGGGFDRRNARAYRRAIEVDRARAALRFAAAELRVIEA